MARREQFTVGELHMIGVSVGAITVLAREASNKIIICKCATASIPSAVAGYATGCLLIDTTTGILYSNLGSTTSCLFVKTYGASPSASVSPSLSPSVSVSPSVSPSGG